MKNKQQTSNGMRKNTPKLGQHFLTTPRVAKTLVDALHIAEEDTVLEIGPGKGALTRELLARGARVVAIEKDRVLVAELRDTFKNEIESRHLELVENDIRDFDPRSLRLEARGYVLAANIPYYITGEILRQFLTTEARPRAMALLMQKEVAERIMARKGKESILSLSVKAYGTPRIVAKVPPGNFYPPPSVDSAILVVTDISRNFFKGTDEKRFFEIIRAGFASKRKFLMKNLSARFELPAVRYAFKACDIPEKARAEDVPIEQWQRLARQLSVISGQLPEK